MSARMNIVYFGSGAFGLPTLERLAAQHVVRAIVTQPDRPAGRGGKLAATPVAQWAAAHAPGVPVFKPEKVNTPEVVDQIRALPSDAWVVIAFGQKPLQRLLADRFAINLHASLLPRWRGAAPITAAILAGDSVTGNSVITLADRMDAGMVLAQTCPPIEIAPTITAGELHDVLAADGPRLIEAVLAQYRSASLNPQRQDESLVTIAEKLSREDDAFDAHKPAEVLRREIHALNPWPGVSVTFVPEGSGSAAGGPIAAPLAAKLLRVRVVEPVPSDLAGATSNPQAGTLVDPQAGVVECGRGRLGILELQPSGRKPMKWEDFRRGLGRELSNAARVVSTRELAGE